MTTPVVPTVNLRDLIKEEYKKCLISPEYFMRKYCYIQHMTRGRMLFSLYKYQSDAINTLENNDRVIVLKARQLGFSTLVSCYALWQTLFFSDKNILVIATKQEIAKNIITKARFAYDHLPVWLRTQCTENNKLNLRFKNGSQIKATSSSGDAGRSEAVSLLIIDEAAFIDNAEEIWISSQATLATGGKAVLISTPNGVGNFFHRTWDKSESSENPFVRIKLDWRNHPERDDEWYKKELAVYGDRAFRQEYEAEFLGSGNTVFDAELVQFYKETYEKEPIERRGFDRNIWIWEQPNYNKPYLVCADVARGDGNDFSTFHVIDAETCVQVAEYKGKIDTTDFGHMLVEISTFYNDALLVIENATQGWAVIQVVINRGYKNLFYMSENPLIVDETAFITNKWNRREKKRVPGFTTSLKTRPLIISKIDEYIRNKEVIIQSSRTLNEMLTFIWENGKAVAQEGYNDDLIMSLAIGLWIRDTSLKLYERSMDIQKKSIDNIVRVGDGQIYSSRPVLYDPYKLNIGNSVNSNGITDSEDLRWLLG